MDRGQLRLYMEKYNHAYSVSETQAIYGYIVDYMTIEQAFWICRNLHTVREHMKYMGFRNHE